MMRAITLASMLLGSVSATAAPCSGATSFSVGKKSPVKVASLPGRLFFRVRELELDFDGSPLAYGARDQGQENICVGLAPAAPPCRGKFQGPCYKVCRTTFANWARSTGDPRSLGRTMCSVGLGGSGCSVPVVSLQKPPNQSYFVSETSLKVSPDGRSPAGSWLAQQEAQLDPAAVRYLVVPSALIKRGVSFGDVGIAMAASSQRPIPFVVGDGGGLGEGSVSLLADLSPAHPPRLEPDVGALGDKVMRYKHGVTGDFRFVIFPRTASLVPGTRNVTKQSAVSLPEWVRASALAAFAKRTSKDEVMRCSI